MSVDKIDRLDELLKTYTRGSKDLVDVKITPLTGPGENYGSVLLKVDATLKNKENTNGELEQLHTVAKVIPREEFFQNLFNVQVTCKVEIAFYEIVVPTLQRFQEEIGAEVMECFPKMYGGRINLNGSDRVDEDAVLLLENLREAGYTNVSRFESFDLPTTKLILKNLAAFHAWPLALKLLQPEVFESKIKPYLKDPRPPESPKDEQKGHPLDAICEILEADEECRLVIPRIKEDKDKIKPGQISRRKEPFVTIAHSDLWVNNIMVKFVEEKPESIKILDFQMPTYQSPAVDLIFFLFSSVQLSVLEEHLDELLRYYHENFIEQLGMCKCDTEQFSFDRFQEELAAVAREKLHQSYLMTAFIIFFKHDKDDTSSSPQFTNTEHVPEVARKRLIYMTKISASKGWLDNKS